MLCTTLCRSLLLCSNLQLELNACCLRKEYVDWDIMLLYLWCIWCTCFQYILAPPLKLTKQKFQQIKDDGWESLLQVIYSFCEEYGIPKLDMEDYIDRHKPRKKTNRINYQHYRYNCLNSIIDLQLVSLMIVSMK